MEADKLKPRPQPCKSCPYRRDVPSGIWAAEEYDLLPSYDCDTPYQPPTPFGCHQASGHLCSGWLGYRNPYNLLALRIGLTNETVDASALNYHTDVPLFASGAEAAEHGKRDIEDPSDEACELVEQLLIVRARKNK
jgi:hypothetical protein